MTDKSEIRIEMKEIKAVLTGWWPITLAMVTALFAWISWLTLS